MSRADAAVALGALLLLAALLAFTLRRPPSAPLARLEVPAAAASALGGERLARSVRYSEPFTLDRRNTVRVAVEGAHGGAVLSLVDDHDRVREVLVEPSAGGASVSRFGAVAPGMYTLRVRGEPPALPAAQGPTIRVAARTGGRPWGLMALAAMLVSAPPLGLAARRLRRRGRRRARKSVGSGA